MDFQTGATLAAPLAGPRLRFHWPDRSLVWDECCIQRSSHHRLWGAGGGGGRWRRRMAGRRRGGVPLTSSQSLTLSVCVCVTGPLCFLLMNSLVSILKRTAPVLSRLRAAIRSLMALLTNIWAGVTVAGYALGFPLPAPSPTLLPTRLVHLVMSQKRHLDSIFIKQFFGICC